MQGKAVYSIVVFLCMQARKNGNVIGQPLPLFPPAHSRLGRLSPPIHDDSFPSSWLHHATSRSQPLTTLNPHLLSHNPHFVRFGGGHDLVVHSGSSCHRDKHHPRPHCTSPRSNFGMHADKDQCACQGTRCGAVNAIRIPNTRCLEPPSRAH